LASKRSAASKGKGHSDFKWRDNSGPTEDVAFKLCPGQHMVPRQHNKNAVQGSCDIAMKRRRQTTAFLFQIERNKGGEPAKVVSASKVLEWIG
jgi:hypothetical protein